MEGYGECWGKKSAYEKCECYSCERSDVKKFREDAEKEKQEGIQSRSESPAREYFEQVQCWKDTACTPRMTKQAFLILRGGDWE